MTMGVLHDGHAELLRRERRESGAVIVSIFLNPLQFGAREDLAKVPGARALGNAEGRSGVVPAT